MIGLNHALTGAAIGLAVQKPLLVIPLAFASHFLLDMLPHFGGHVYQWGHRHFGKIIAVDGVVTLLAILLIIFAVPAFMWPVLLGVFFAMLPDALLVPYYLSGKRPHWFHSFHLNIQWYEQPPGLLVEGLYLLLVGNILFG
ncbi:MAG TPA: hypothetical protein VFT87_00720 [Candidatus Saccharimonadales bacterium]|nr:hypothetical protein [Candidatus Saccharimonadales bacterium]